ncbi:MAG: 4-alpha-glucanotransferase [Bacteroidaceae bacterium]|nr:4-alpha-glucanotransferase [Bacteroidaceae bacterium]
MKKLLFNLEYQTVFGEQLTLNFLQKDGASTAHPMLTLDGRCWTAELPCEQEDGSCLDYYYSVCRGEKVTRHEWMTVPHRLELAASGAERYVVYDHWNDMPEDSFMYSSAFTECVMARKRELSVLTGFQRTVRLKVRAPQLRQNQRLAIVGAPVYLGAWDTDRALTMTEHEYHEWVVSLDADRLPGRFEFKFVVLNDRTDVSPLWENCDNRFVELPDMGVEKGDVLVYELPQAFFPVYAWKGAGTVIPVFSLRSEGSFGVGDFGDLKMMIDWCAKTQQRILQILPINDTNMTGSWEDSYPYNSISIYALHPQYMDLRQLPPLKDEARSQHYEQLRQVLNQLPQIDYERMFKAKMDYLRELFAQEGAKVRRTKAYKEFVARNEEWLEPYARFCVKRDSGVECRVDSDESATAIPSGEGTAAANSKLSTLNSKLNFWYYVQFNLDQQMHSAHEHARKQRVILKGDIPIGVNRDGADVMAEPRYFNLNGQAGAPPDAFSEDGQNWGFPTYNWDEMLKDGCQWWARRFRKMQEYFDAYRIDHVLGFFRIWEIPVPYKSGLYGQFQPSLPMTREEVEAYGVPFREELFLPDHKAKAQQESLNSINAWHPRINAPKMKEFQTLLSEEERQRFWNLYNDYFYRRNNHFWYQEAMKKLPRLTQATRMLCCAEDLGMVPDCVPWVMNELRILSLEIQSMPKDPAVKFGHLSRNPYRSVCTISTHDMATLRQWWDEDEARTQEYYNTMLYRSGAAPHPLPGWLAKDIVSRHLTSPSMLCLLSLQDWLSLSEKYRLADANAERINIPANPRHYWRYRMHLTIEQLLQADDLNNELQELIVSSGRK